jgi:hypothetical protein
MKHASVRWNPATREWYCTRCGRISDHTSLQDANQELDQFECELDSFEASSVPPETATQRLIRKPYKMTLRIDRSGSRFVAAHSDDGKTLIRLELFHDTVPSLRSITIGFEVLRGTTPEQTRALVEAMNERIIGVAVSPK